MIVVVDASAVLEVLLDAPERDTFVTAFARADDFRMSVVNAWEVTAKLRPMRPQIRDTFRLLANDITLRLEPATLDHLVIAERASMVFGKGMGGKLNLADCFAYALAQSLKAPLLFKGDDFPTTDIRPAL